MKRILQIFPFKQTDILKAHQDWYTLIEQSSNTVYGKTFERKNFCGFQGFLAFSESFTAICFVWMVVLMGQQVKREAFPANGGFVV